MSGTVDVGLRAHLAHAHHDALRHGASHVEPRHLLYAMLDDKAVRAHLSDLGLDARPIREALDQQLERSGLPAPTLGDDLRRVLAAADAFAVLGGRTARVADVVLALVTFPTEQVERAFEGSGVSPQELRDRLQKPSPEGRAAPERGSTPSEIPKTPLLDEFGTDYSAMAREGTLSSVFGRDDELATMLEVLLRRGKNNVLLCGEPGVGKTAVVEGLAQMCAAPDAGPDVAHFRFVELSLTDLVSGTSLRGQHEQRLQAVLREAAAVPGLVLFIDEFHTVVGCGDSVGGLDAANILKPALARGGIRCIGATTDAEFRKHIEPDLALSRRFHPVTIAEPNEAQTRAILEGLRPQLATHHGVQIGAGAIDEAVRLGGRYLPDRRFPDVAIDLVDSAASALRVASSSAEGDRPPQLDKCDIQRVVAKWTGVAVGDLGDDAKDALQDLQMALSRRVVGQSQAIETVATAIRTARAQLTPAERPDAVLLLAGPTGVGKTELAKAVAARCYRGLIRIDMGEYTEAHSVSKLTGSPPGYIGHDEGGQLVTALRRQPSSVVLFDEVEKAHPRVLDALLAAFDEGRLTGADGKAASLSDATVVLTSNIAIDATSRDPRGELGDHFRSEFVNRLTHVVAFRSLDQDDAMHIMRGQAAKLRRRVRARHGISLCIVDAALRELVRDGFDPRYGARDLARTFERRVTGPLAERILASGCPDHIEAGLVEDRIIFCDGAPADAPN